MRAVLQRVTRASVTVDGEVLGKIGKGFMILLGVEDADTEEITDKIGILADMQVAFRNAEQLDAVFPESHTVVADGRMWTSCRKYPGALSV